MQNHKDILKKFFGFSGYRGQQEAIIERILKKQHCLVIMPTGSGKSLTYQIPALLMEDLTIVISPLISLMKDQVDVLRSREIDAAYINSSLTKGEREKRYHNTVKGKYKLLYVTPERFRKKEFTDVLKRRIISMLVIDEAHCISEWGHDFRPDYTRIKEFRSTMNHPPTIALTATATPVVQKDIIHQLGIKSSQIKVYHEGIDRPNLYLEVLGIWGEEEKLIKIEQIIKNNPGNGIIYFVLIKDLVTMSELLEKKKIKHLRYHGDLSADQRKRIQNVFMRGENNIVLATNAFGMGIDKENIRFVTHAQIPSSLESYYQEIGRAGRDGKPSHCGLLYDEQDLNIQLEFIKWNNPTAGFYDRLYRLLQSDIERANAEGMDYLREQLTYKNRRDFRLETAIGILDRYGVIEGDLANKNLRLVNEIPQELIDQDYLNRKLKNEQNKLYQMVLYVKEKICRKAFIHKYFGLKYRDRCYTCDIDQNVNRHIV
jgi:ATP-dependent DNA helicase RecQ